MHTRDLVKRAFADEGLYKSSDPKMKKLLQSIDDAPMDCWPEFAEKFRRDYYDLYDKIVPVLFKTGDPLVTSILVRYSDLSEKQEKAQITQYISRCNEKDNEATLMQIAKLNSGELNKVLKKKKLTPAVKRVIAEFSVVAKKAKNITIKKTVKPIPKQLSIDKHDEKDCNGKTDSPKKVKAKSSKDNLAKTGVTEKKLNVSGKKVSKK